MISSRSDQVVPDCCPTCKSLLCIACLRLLTSCALQNNIPAVNESYNELLIEDEDHKTLRDSTDSQDAFDALGLAARLEKHDLLEFRRCR